MSADASGSLVAVPPLDAVRPRVVRGGLVVLPALRALGLPALVGATTFALHAAVLGDWLIDDAGISFAYARSLATGHGLVAQPGAPPVEGFSNPLWTLLLATAYALGARDTLLASRVLATGLVTLAFACLAAASREDGDGGPGALVPPLLTAASAPFAIWAASGLENALLCALAALSFLLALRARRTDRPGVCDVASGLVASLLALTRPDGVLYAAAYPAVRLLPPAERPGRLVARLARFALGLVPPLAAYALFRLSWFGDWAPNTYHAKGGPRLAGLLDAGKARALLDGLAGGAGAPLLALGLAAIGALAVRRRIGRALPVAGIYLAVGVASFLLLPEDWMGEFRFATPVAMFGAWISWSLARRAARLPPPVLQRAASAAVAAGLLATIGIGHAARVAAFASEPTVPLARVAAFAEAYARLAARVDAREPSLLTADVGGVLLDGRLRVHDLAGLCDRTIARTLGGDPERFRGYVFEELRPTLIHVHGHWARQAALESDERMRRDYLPLWEAYEAPDGGLVARPAASGQAPWSADYVRREAVGDDPVRLAALREAFVRERLPWLGRERAWRVTVATLARRDVTWGKRGKE
jgi:hypothetical protein